MFELPFFHDTAVTYHGVGWMICLLRLIKRWDVILFSQDYVHFISSFHEFNDLNDLSHAITPIYVTPTRNGRVSISCNFESTKYWFSLCPKLGHSPTVTRISTKFSGIEALVICLWGKWFKNIPETKEHWCLFHDHLIRNSPTAMPKKRRKKEAVFHSQCSWN